MAAICRRRILKLALLHLIRKRRKSTSKRKHWVRPLFQGRLARGEFNLYDELRTNDREYFFRYFRMNPERFDHLHELVKDKIFKKDTCLRKAISTRERLAITLSHVISFSSHYDYEIGTANLKQSHVILCNLIQSQ